MANTYKWTINQMNAHIEQYGEENVIFTVHWTYTDSDDSDPVISVSNIGTQGFTYEEGDPFIPYTNTQGFEDVVIGWLDDAIDVDAMKASLDAQIELIKNPVNEDLYFTFVPAED